ncbi:MAG: AtpZ/AtpI family protein [Acidimicrobiia bacterium]|jgi:ATP synthase protein I
MSDPTPEERRRQFGRVVGRKADRRIEARRRSDSVWFWLGMLGLIGWSVAIPTVAGVALGVWLDRVAPASFSWVLTMLVLGLALGLLNAWLWVRRESADEEVPPPPPSEPASENEEVEGP